jgi:hypothetical protein
LNESGLNPNSPEVINFLTSTSSNWKQKITELINFINREIQTAQTDITVKTQELATIEGKIQNSIAARGTLGNQKQFFDS